MHHRSSFFRRNRKYIVVATVILAVVVAVLEFTNTTYIFHKEKVVSGPIPVNNDTSPDSTQSSSSVDRSGSNNHADSSTSSTEKNNTTPVSGSDLLAPSGSLVSNHYPSLKNRSAEESICLTTPGAVCTIKFTKGGITKTLEGKQADSTGTVVWPWDIKTAGFVVGSWEITATTTLKGQTKSTTDSQNLEVQP